MSFYIEKKVNGTEKTSARWRTIFVWLMISSVLGFLLINLIDLQLVNGEENLIRARNISQVEEIERAPRGIIFDTNGKILAKNVPAYTLYIKTSEFGEENADNVFEKLSGI